MHPLNLNQIMLAEGVASPTPGFDARFSPLAHQRGFLSMTKLTDTGAALAAMRQAAPLVHCITNYVAMNISANVVLAAGASPAMIHTPEESGEFAAIAGALTVNIGTLSPHWVEGMIAAAKGASGAGKPWVLDPVAHFASQYRAGVARNLVTLRPTVIRGNASEIIALSGGDASGQGADAGDPVEAAEGAARKLASETGAIVAVTGVFDFVTDGARAVRVGGGHEVMPLITALGCSLTCLVGAFAAAVDDPFDATVGALSLFGLVGLRAGAGTPGPGTFAVRFLDELHSVQPGDLSAADLVSAA
jgi:hydroxyethylthiazole kinase